MLPKDYKVKGQTNEICLPYEKHFKDPSEEESFKLLGDLQIHNMGSGYTCFVNSFAIFSSPDKEIKISKSPVMKAFEEVNTIDKFIALGLPIKKQTSCPDFTNNIAYEIDLS